MPKIPNPTDIHVGRRVRMRRLMLDLSQTALADKLGITFQQVQKYEKGANRISASRLQQIANVLQVPIPFFFDGLSDPTSMTKREGETAALPHINEFIASSDGLSLIKAYRSIRTHNVRRAIVDIVEELAN